MMRNTISIRHIMKKGFTLLKAGERQGKKRNAAIIWGY